nr:HAMP domain-containing sensor histidine kinase [Corallococcus exiguus]
MAIHLVAEGVVGQVTEKQADLLFAAREDCERLQGIVDDPAGPVADPVRAAPVGRAGGAHGGAGELVEQALSAQRALAEDRGVRLTQSLSPDVETVRVDPDRLQLVLGNLVGNGVKHTPHDGEVSVHVSREGTLVRFEVKDTGEGIPRPGAGAHLREVLPSPGRTGGRRGAGIVPSPATSSRLTAASWAW